MKRAIPTIDLHCHLDGSLSIDSIFENMSKQGFRYDLNEIRNLCTVSKECNSLTEYLTKFDIPVRSMYDYDSTKKTALDFMENIAKDEASYVEVRFAPSLIATKHFKDRDVLEAVIEGLKEGTEITGVEQNVIVCAMRHHSLEENMQAFNLAKEYERFGVCGVDLAGDENFYPTSDFKDLFLYAKKIGLNYTIHAGECHSSQSIRDAIEMGAKRIGHGIAMAGNAELKMICRDRHIGIEMCPISNYQTGAVKSGENYPFREFLEDQLLVTVNTDNRTVSGTSMSKELAFVRNKFGLKEEEEVILYENAVEVCFATEEVKNKLLKLI